MLENKAGVVISEPGFARPNTPALHNPNVELVTGAIAASGCQILNPRVLETGFKPDDITSIDQADFVVAESTLLTTPVCMGLAYAVGRGLPRLVLVNGRDAVLFTDDENHRFISPLNIEPVLYMEPEEITGFVTDFVTNLPTRNGHIETEISNGDLKIDYLSHQVSVAGKPVQLTGTEYRLLVQLASNLGNLQDHKRLFSEVWGTEFISPDAVRVYMARLRHKLDKGDIEKYIETVRGQGYRMRNLNELTTGSV